MEYAKQWIDESDVEAVARALRLPMITRGEKVCEFEEAVAKYYEMAFAVAFNSGTSAMHAAYAAADVGPFDVIVTTPNTYVGTVTGAIARGAKLHLVDIELATGQMGDEVIASPSRGRLIYVPVDFAGAPSKKIQVSDPNAVIIEDAAHSFGARGVCQESDMTMFSFHPAKTITTGEGGMVVTNNETYAKRLRRFRNNGLEDGNVCEISGNYHLTNFQAALGLSQLKRLDQILEKRRKLMNIYRGELEGCVTLLADHPDSANHLAVALIENDRDRVREQLAKREIGTQVHYVPLYRQPALLGDTLPQMELYYAQALSLPLYYELDEDKVREIAKLVRTPLPAPQQS